MDPIWWLFPSRLCTIGRANSQNGSLSLMHLSSTVIRKLEYVSCISIMLAILATNMTDMYRENSLTLASSRSISKFASRPTRFVCWRRLNLKRSLGNTLSLMKLTASRTRTRCYPKLCASSTLAIAC